MVRRLRNCYREMDKEEVAKILTRFAQKMKDSGYDEKIGREVVDEGVKKYREQVRRDDRGERPLYRSPPH